MADTTYGRFPDDERVIWEVEQIMRDIRQGFATGDRSVSHVSIARTNDGRAWTITFGTDYPNHVKAS